MPQLQLEETHPAITGTTYLGDDCKLTSPLRYPGGKSRVAKRFIPYMPPHRRFREPFAGGGAVFFHKPKAGTNWINDLHPGLYAFYVAVRDHFDEFAELCRAQGGDLRERFVYWAGRRDLMEMIGDEHLVERAVQYYFINRTVWGGRVVYDPKRASRLYFSNPGGWNNLDKKLVHLRKISEKLRDVKITCVDFADCMAGSTEDTFIYADPPYYRDSTCHATDKLYDKSFSIADHERLAKVLTDTSAKVMISYDDRPEVRKLYEGWNFVELQWKYAGTHAVTDKDKANGTKEKKVVGNELLILNYTAGDEDLAGE